MTHSLKTVRLQKVLAQAGLGSRRKCEQFIVEGKIMVNGKVVTELGTRVDTDEDAIFYRGKKILSPSRIPKIYILLYKPCGYITSMHDDKHRSTVMDLMPKIAHRVFPVGRLDYNTEGLLLLTNDGELSNALTHPGNMVPRNYLVKVSGVSEEKIISRLKKGIWHNQNQMQVDSISMVRTTSKNSWFSVTIHEGKNREIRRMFEALGHPVLKLKRTKFGFLSLSGLQKGEYRFLASDEIKKLQELCKS